MKIYHEADKSRAMCENDGLVTTTFAYRDVPFRDGSGIVKDILVAVCDKCGDVVAIPPQSSLAIKATREKAAVSVEANLPAIYIDTLDLAALRIDPNLTLDFRKRLLLYYVHTYAANRKLLAQLIENLREENMFVTADKNSMRKRLSMKVTPAMSREIEAVMQATSLSKTELIKSVISQIHKDIVQPDRPKQMKLLKTLAAVAA
ncbi:hypothetical protein SAE02_27180 [Skermanella aerolata]|uniref:Uncharacterized protein n=1 Tax=Skermanella aerolata TaxID=393310 RepID=A0A512DQV3_9PROT|nr:hypothetical protein [Skermanella aerolata]KJB92750.1 hypothetical protein N826_21385 [Skermanella aerolata KACC 11604]GEO38570.1 hypothetical protein SAE02_27180 [Skermanella aerolata]